MTNQLPSPMIFEWNGEAMVPTSRFIAEANRRYVVHERYMLEETHERNMVKHRRQFAFVKEAWKNLPDCYRDEPWAQSPDHMRRYFLIKCGYSHTETIPCGSNAEALRWLPRLRADNPYAIVTVRGSLIYRYTAESQSLPAMGAQRFYESRAAIMAEIDALMQVDQGATQKAALTNVA